MNSKKIGKNIDMLEIVFKVILTLLVIFTTYPIIFILLTSFKTTSDFYSNIWGFPETIVWENYAYAWETAKIGQYFFNSIKIVGTVVFFTVVISSLAGYALAKFNIRNASLIMMAIFLTTMLPSESILMPMYLINAKLGFTGTYPGMILPYIGWGVAFACYIYYNFFSTIPSEIIESARMDGAGEFTTFLKIVFPLMSPATATVIIFTFLSWWGEMLWASVELSVSSLKTLPLGLLAFVQSAGTDWGPLSAASCIVIIPLIVCFIFFQKYFIAGLTGGAVKG